MEERKIDIYFDDLSQEKQNEIMATIGSNGNYDIIPIASIVTEEKIDKESDSGYTIRQIRFKHYDDYEDMCYDFDDEKLYVSSADYHRTLKFVHNNYYHFDKIIDAELELRRWYDHLLIEGKEYEGSVIASAFFDSNKGFFIVYRGKPARVFIYIITNDIEE